jgi:glycosyltransferase involved in cell wall biosynthesis
MTKVSFIMTPELGGGPRNVYMLTKLLNKRGNSCKILSPYIDYKNNLGSDSWMLKSSGKYMSYVNKHLIQFNSVDYINYPLFFLKNCLLDPWSIKRYSNFDVYVSTAWPTVYTGRILSKINRKPLLYFVQAYETTLGYRNPKLYKKLVDATYKMNLPMFTQSKWLKDYFREKFSLNVEWIGLGINHEKFYEKRVKKKKQIYTVARLEYDKGFDVFVEAMNLLWKERKDIKIVISGTRKALTNKSINFEYEFLDWINDDDLLSNLYAESVFVNTGRREAIPMPPLEAMACGSPIVISDMGGAQEYAFNNKNSLVCNINEPASFSYAVQSILDNEDLRIRLSKNAVETAKAYDWNNVIERLSLFLEKVNVNF